MPLLAGAPKVTLLSEALTKSVAGRPPKITMGLPAQVPADNGVGSVCPLVSSRSCHRRPVAGESHSAFCPHIMRVPGLRTSVTDHNTVTDAIVRPVPGLRPSR